MKVSLSGNSEMITKCHIIFYYPQEEPSLEG